MDQRVFLGAMAGGLLAAPLAAEPQQQVGTPSRIGVLLNLYPPNAHPPQALRQRLRDLGYVEGQNLVIDWRYQQGGSNRLPALAAELVRLKPDVIVADVAAAIRAAMQATSTIPIVMATSADAVGGGLVTSLRQPGGNVTGVTIMLAEMTAKRLQLLKEVAPHASHVAVFWDTVIPWHRAMLKEIEATAPALRLQPIVIGVRNRDDFGDAFSKTTEGRADAVFISHTMTTRARDQIIAFAAKNRLPTMFMDRDYVVAGGLVSYGPNLSDVWGGAAVYVDKILKGSQAWRPPRRAAHEI
jgi:putative ABC transport system substrate-binding protein